MKEEHDQQQPVQIRSSERLKEVLELIRQQRNLSKRAFAKLLAIDAKTYNRWIEKGQFPNEQSLNQLRRVLGKEVVDLFTTIAPSAPIPPTQPNQELVPQQPVLSTPTPSPSLPDQPNLAAQQQSPEPPFTSISPPSSDLQEHLNQAHIPPQPFVPAQQSMSLQPASSLHTPEQPDQPHLPNAPLAPLPLISSLLRPFRQRPWLVPLLVLLTLLIIGAATAGGWSELGTDIGHVFNPESPRVAKPANSPDVNRIFQELSTRAPTRTDALRQQDSFDWKLEPVTQKDKRTCMFTNGALHAIARQTWPLALCTEQASMYTAVAVQVDMTFLPSGGKDGIYSGGIILHAKDVSDNAPMYRARIGSDGTYDIFVQDDTNIPKHKGRLNTCPNPQDPRAQSAFYNGDAPTSPYIIPSTNKINTVTLIAVGNLIALFVNGHHIQTVCDSDSPSGLIGLFAAPPSNIRTDVAFSNLMIWVL